MAYSEKQMVGIRERVKQLLDKEGVSMNQMALTAGINTSNFCSALAGKKNLSMKSLRLLSDKYGVSFRWLEAGIGEMFSAPSAEELMKAYDNAFQINGSNSPNVTQYIGGDGKPLHLIDKMLLAQLQEKNKEIERLNARIDKLLSMLSKK